MPNPNILTPKQLERDGGDSTERQDVIVGFDETTGKPQYAPLKQVVGHAATTNGSMDTMHGGYTGHAPSNDNTLVHVGGGRYIPRHLLNP